MNRQMRRMMERSQMEQQKRRDNQLKRKDKENLVLAWYALVALVLSMPKYLGKRMTINPKFIIGFLRDLEEEAGRWSKGGIDIDTVFGIVEERTGISFKEGDE